MDKCEFVAIKGLVVRKDNIVYARKLENGTGIEFAIAQNSSFPPNSFIVNFQESEERDRTFDKIMVALTGDLT
ncbi:hypothetical protein C1H57_08415 [Clostridium sp. 2-1]|uniref:hypothetical protein n=1 Tax=Clostridium TaxID=1485 RepID=UPI000CDB723C|nr:MULTISPECIES: hypothetical protein [Clostridium]MBN7575430.1 hypothetical protein [Clostridium beijerinckii]MBN7580741.1 hypothetical protein [Clostridium beijerinckii]MBN7585194.1 hypothetical protein [Clostridium beijerinckii]MBO0522000.1 hypothetical protein [Clostridium beijerinckii]POO91832.1 hypothetical protein C1H57_08415 [Clostridium sp. 2-1]